MVSRKSEEQKIRGSDDQKEFAKRRGRSAERIVHGDNTGSSDLLTFCNDRALILEQKKLGQNLIWPKAYQRYVSITFNF